MKKKVLFIIVLMLGMVLLVSSTVVYQNNYCPTKREVFGRKYKIFQQYPIILEGKFNFKKNNDVYFVIDNVIKGSITNKVKIDSFKLKYEDERTVVLLKRRVQRSTIDQILFLDSLKSVLELSMTNLKYCNETEIKMLEFYQTDKFAEIKKIYNYLEDNDLKSLQKSREKKRLFNEEVLEEYDFMNPLIFAFRNLDYDIFVELYENWDLLSEDSLALFKMAVKSNNRKVADYLLANSQNEDELYSALDFLVEEFFIINDCFGNSEKIKPKIKASQDMSLYKNINLNLMSNLNYFYNSIEKISKKRLIDYNQKEFKDNILLKLIRSNEFANQQQEVSTLIKYLFENSKTADILVWKEYQEWQNCIIELCNSFEEEAVVEIENNIHKLLDNYDFEKIKPINFFPLRKYREQLKFIEEPQLRIKFLSYMYNDDYAFIIKYFLRKLSGADMAYILEDQKNSDFLISEKQNFFQFYLEMWGRVSRNKRNYTGYKKRDNSENPFNERVFERFLEYNPDIEYSDQSGNQVLYYAAAIPNPYYTKKLIEMGADVTHQNKKERTALIWAGQMGNIPAMELLLENGADINFRDKRGNSLLHRCLFTLDTEVIKFLIDKGVDIHHKNKFDSTPLMFAVKNPRGARNNFERIHILMKNGAVPKGTDTEGNTFQDLVNQHRQKEELIEIFKEYGYDFS